MLHAIILTSNDMAPGFSSVESVLKLYMVFLYTVQVQMVKMSVLLFSC